MVPEGSGPPGSAPFSEDTAMWGQWRESDKFSDLSRAIAAATAAGATGSGLPNACYTDADVFALERDALFSQGWACIGFGKDVPAEGDVFPVDFLGEPLLLARGKYGRVRVFHNVCSHRGMVLVDEPGNCRGLIRCPYHSWCYDLDGALRRAPYVGGPGSDEHPDFDRTAHGLRAVRAETWMDMVFVNLSGDAAAFADANTDLLDRWGEFADAPLTHGGAESTLTFDLATNWKLAVENYCESYHLPWVHPGLNSYSRIEDHYPIEAPGRFSGQGTRVYSPVLTRDEKTFPALPGLSEAWDVGAEYIALYPNVLLGIHKDHFFAILLLPDGPARTHERCEIYYFDAACAGPDYAGLRAANARTWQTVFAEDVGVVEGMQRGRASSGFAGGVLTPVMDSPTRCFHRWAAGRLADALSLPGAAA